MKTAEEEMFSNINRYNSRKVVFKVTKPMEAENCNVDGDKCVKNDKGELVLTDDEKRS